MPDDTSTSKPRSLLDRFRSTASPPKGDVALERVRDVLPVPKPRKERPVSWATVARFVAKETGDFSTVIVVVKDILNSPDTEARDKIKAAEFLSKFVKKNPQEVKVQVSGPGGRPIAHAHAHIGIGGRGDRTDLTKLTDAELDALETILSAAQERKELPPGDVIDVEADE